MQISASRIYHYLNFFNILKPNGIVHIMVKQGKGSHVVKEKLSNYKGRLFTFYEEGELIKMLKRSNFTPIYSKIGNDDMGRKEVKWITVWGKKIN